MAFTLDTYAHVLPGMQADAAEDLADWVFGPIEKQETRLTSLTARTTRTATSRRRQADVLNPM